MCERENIASEATVEKESTETKTSEFFFVVAFIIAIPANVRCEKKVFLQHSLK